MTGVQTCALPILFRDLHHSVYRKVRGEFLRPKYKEVSKSVEFGEASAERVKFLLLHEHGLSENRVLSALKRLEKTRKKAAKNPALRFAHDPLAKTKSLSEFKPTFRPSKSTKTSASFEDEKYGVEHLGITPGPWLNDKPDNLPALKHGEHRYNNFLRRRLESAKGIEKPPKNAPVGFSRASELDEDEERKKEED